MIDGTNLLLPPIFIFIWNYWLDSRLRNLSDLPSIIENRCLLYVVFIIKFEKYDGSDPNMYNINLNNVKYLKDPFMQLFLRNTKVLSRVLGNLSIFLAMI